MGTVEVDGQLFEYEIVGEGFPVVAVQNVQAPLRMWPTPGETAALNEAGFSLVAYRHLGTTDTIVGIAADVGRLLDHLGLGSVCLWGYSQGAMTAQELALARPDIVSSAVMMATRARLSAYDRFRYAAIEPVIDRSDVGIMLSLFMSYGLDALCDDDVFTARSNHNARWATCSTTACANAPTMRAPPTASTGWRRSPACRCRAWSLPSRRTATSRRR